MSDHVLSAEKINKYFRTKAGSHHVLKDVSLDIQRGEFVSIVGKSGCGKSTLLYILSTMDTDFDGELKIDARSTRKRSNAELAEVRNSKIGFVFQFHYLLSEFNVLHNVMLPALKLKKLSAPEIELKAMEKLNILGIADHARKKPNQISGGEKQRVAIARALINDPLIIMADEPTGNLDKKNGEIVFNLFQELAHEFHQTMLIVTHDLDFAQATDRVIHMDDGRIVY